MLFILFFRFSNLDFSVFSGIVFCIIVSIKNITIVGCSNEKSLTSTLHQNSNSWKLPRNAVNVDILLPGFGFLRFYRFDRSHQDLSWKLYTCEEIVKIKCFDPLFGLLIARTFQNVLDNDSS